jgi:hypothetical protein
MGSKLNPQVWMLYVDTVECIDKTSPDSRLNPAFSFAKIDSYSKFY